MLATASTVRAIFNPSASSGRARSAPARWPGLVWEQSRDAAHLQELVRAAQDEPLQALVLAGGDGTVQLAANALRSRNRVPLAILPAGSGNDFAHQLGLRSCQLPSLLERGRPRLVDLGLVEQSGQRFCCVASLGFDRRALELIHGSRLPRSRLLNVYASLRAILAARPLPLVVRWEGGSYEGPAMLAAVTNTAGYGGGFLLSPGARLDDGLLDICIIGDLSRAALLMQFPRIFSGRHGAHPGVILARSPWVTLSSSAGPLPICLDGEPPDPTRCPTTPVRLRCLPGALRVLTPEEA